MRLPSRYHSGSGSAARGFTLIEALVVIAVLALLAGLLFPVFSEVRDKARQAACMSGVRQLGMALLIYAGDYDERFPTASDWWEARGSGWVWVREEFIIDVSRGSLYPYVRDARLYSCPVRPGWFGYAMSHDFSGASLAAIAAPSTSALLLEESERAFAGRGPNDGVIYFDRLQDWLTERHAGGGIVVYADGRTRWEHASRRWNGAMFGTEVR